MRKKILAAMLALSMVIPNAADVRIAKANPADRVEICMDSNEEVTTNINEEISGQISAKQDVTSVTYSVTSKEQNEVYVQNQEATVEGKEWIIDDLVLRPGQNTIEVQVETADGKTAKKEVEVNYDNGSFVDTGKVAYADEAGNYAAEQLFVMFHSNCSDARCAEIIQKAGGTQIGVKHVLDEYQVEFSGADYKKLMEIAHTLETYDEVVSARLNYIEEVQAVTAVYPNDPWKETNEDGTWDMNNPGGTNWGMEAIQAPYAWAYKDQLAYKNGKADVKIGITDSGFDTDHEDLKANLSVEVQNQEASHGTHVAGIIGATWDNQKGVSGVVPNADMYGYGHQTFEDSITLVENGAKVVNISLGYPYSWTDEKTGITYYQTDQHVRNYGKYAAQQIAKLLEKGVNNFILVQSAGNSNVDSKYNGWVSSMTQENVAEALDILGDSDKFSVSDIMSHKIVVAAVENKGNNKYQIAGYSNWGSGIDIAAPGSNIYSSVLEEKQKYGYKSGTSMAAPMTTGVAALIWAANPDLTAVQVKDILINSTNVKVPASTGDNSGIASYDMVNSYLSVKAALAAKNPGTLKSDLAASKATEGQKLTFTATKGASGTKYAFYIDGIKVQDYSSMNTCQWTVEHNYAKNPHTIMAVMRYADGTTAAESTKIEVNKAPIISGMGLNPTSGNAYVGDMVKATVGCVYGTAPFTRIIEVQLEGGSRKTVYSGTDTGYFDCWKPEKAGTYTIYYTIKDANGISTNTGKMTYEVKKLQNVADIYYNNSSWSQAYVHYKVGNGSWTNVPGCKMEKSDNSAYTWMYRIALEEGEKATVCFNNGNGNWDNNNSSNYEIKAGCYAIENGNVKEVEQGLRIVSFTADKTFPQNSGTALTFTVKTADEVFGEYDWSVNYATWTVYYEGTPVAGITTGTNTNIKTFSYTPTKEGNYQVAFGLKDNEGTIVKQTFDFVISDEKQGNYVYFDNSISKWEQVYAYVWNDSGDVAVFAATKVDDNLYHFHIDESYTHILFKNTEGTSNWDKQTVDQSIPVEGNNCFKADSTSSKTGGSWYKYN